MDHFDKSDRSRTLTPEDGSEYAPISSHRAPSNDGRSTSSVSDCKETGSPSKSLCSSSSTSTENLSGFELKVFSIILGTRVDTRDKITRNVNIRGSMTMSMTMNCH